MFKPHKTNNHVPTKQFPTHNCKNEYIRCKPHKTQNMSQRRIVRNTTAKVNIVCSFSRLACGIRMKIMCTRGSCNMRVTTTVHYIRNGLREIDDCNRGCAL